MTSPERAREGAETGSQSADIAELRKQLEETRKQLEATKKELDDLKAWRTTPTEAVQPTREHLASFSWEDDIDTPLYGWWGREKITKRDVLEVVNGLKEPYNTEITNFIKSNDIEGLQKYLNKMIKDGKIDVEKLEAALKAKDITFDGAILEDGKFGPQTLETIKFILQQQEQVDPQPDPEKEKGPDLWWIPQEMSTVIKDIRDTNPEKNWSPERNIGEQNFDVDVDRHVISIATWGTALNSPEREHVPGNRCEINWDTGAITVYCNEQTYEMPVHLEGFKLKDGYPDWGDNANRERVRAFADIGNLMNQLKAHAVFNGEGAIEEASGTLEMNDSVLGLQDTDLVSKAKFNTLNRNYSHLGVKFDKETKVQTASLLTAMKLDLGKISWTPDIESGTWLRQDPLDDEHKKWVKHYSKTYGR